MTDYNKLIIGLPFVMIIGIILKAFPYWFPRKLKNIIIGLIIYFLLTIDIPKELID